MDGVSDSDARSGVTEPSAATITVSAVGAKSDCKTVQKSNSEAFSSNMEPNVKHSFGVWYLGSATMHRLCSQSLQPWVMAEVKRKRDGIQEVTLEIGTDGILHARGRNPSGEETGEIIHSHPLQTLSRFARLHQDPRCFGYLTQAHFSPDLVCHVYLATTDNTIPELFQCIREISKDIPAQAPNMGEGHEPGDNVKATYEVRYLGRAKVTCKKLTSDAMDLLAERLTVWEEDIQKKQKEERAKRQRHASGASIKSLPTSLDEEVSITENNLGDQLNRLRQGANASASNFTNLHYDSADSSADDLLSGGETSSSENLLEEGEAEHHPPQHAHNLPHRQQGHQHQQHHHHQPQHYGHHQHGGQHPHGSHHSDKHSYSVPKVNTHCESTSSVGDGCSSEEMLHESSSYVVKTHVMLFQVGNHDIDLISLDEKLTILERKFKDIASVSQGNQRKDVFGIIVREPDNTLVCYVLNCHDSTVVNEIMSTMQTAFQSAYQRNAIKQQMCGMCPLHQLNRLIQEVTKLNSQAAHEMLVKRIQNLPEREIAELSNKIKMEGPTTYEESVEVMMIALRQLCEHRQREHTHISEGARPGKNELNLFDDRKFVLFEGLRNKAKKSLATSFENLLRIRKKEDARDAFRKRSWTTDGDSSSGWGGTRSVDSSVASSPDVSPLPSPVSKTFSHDFPSPPHSPEPRKRSSTLGAIPDRDRERILAKQRLRDVNHNTPKATNSPMKTMYLLATSPQQLESSSSSPLTSPQDEGVAGTTPQNAGSWRKAIFERVCTPSSHNSSLVTSEVEQASDEKGKKSSADYRALWKKAMLETLLLIRMEKENSSIRARQEEESLERKLDYQELTPCLRDVTKVWDDLLNSSSSGSAEPVSHNVLLDSVKKGVPRNMRGQIWKLLAQHQSRHSNTDAETAGMSDHDYEDLLKQLTTHQHAILIDLGRTFPGHPYFAKALGPGQLELFNLLKAYSLLDTEVGYCQGISFIAGILLMHMEEMAAFELIRHLMIDLGLRKQYCPSMMALQVKLYQLMRLIHDHFKDLYNHFEMYEIAPALYATPWFLTLFASQFPLGFVARVFDMIFIQGPDVIFKVGLMLLGSHRELILQCDSFEGVVDFLKTTLPEMAQVQMERVINQAFDLDISKQLQAYEVEYHVFSEEMLYSPRHNHHSAPPSLTGANHPAVIALQQTVRRLRQQNLELVEKLQRAHSQQHSLQLAANEHRVNEDKLKSRVRTLELERSDLLQTVASLKNLIPESERSKLPHLLQMQSLSASSSPSLPRKSGYSCSPVREDPNSSSRGDRDLYDTSPVSDSDTNSGLDVRGSLGQGVQGSVDGVDTRTGLGAKNLHVHSKSPTSSDRNQDRRPGSSVNASASHDALR